jgi:hypothetical protein
VTSEGATPKRRLGRPLGGLLVVGALLAGGAQLSKRPVDAQLAIDLGDGGAQGRRLELKLLDAEGALARALDLRFDERGAPRTVTRSIPLRPGRYRVEARLTFSAGPPLDRTSLLEVAEAGTYSLSLVGR